MSDLLEQHVRIRLAHDILSSVNVVQGDTGRELYFVIDDYDIPSDSEFRIYIRKPSGKEIYNYCYYANGEIVVQLTTQMVAEIGQNVGQIQIISSNHTQITSFNFKLIVEENMIVGSDIVSKDEFGILDELINNARITIADMLELSSTVQSQEEERVQAETVRESAEALRVQAESTRVSEFDDIKEEFANLKKESETATSNAQTATENANTATSNANSAASAANDAADRANEISDHIEETISGVIKDDEISTNITFSSQKISSGFIAIDDSIYTALSNNGNLDTYINNGNYYADSSIVASLTNIPSGLNTSFKLIVDKINNSTFIQIIIDSSSNLWFRTYNGSSFGNWIQNITSIQSGILSDLSTNNKDSIIGAINELSGNTGNIAHLPTNNKDNVVSSITELYNRIQFSSSEPTNQQNNDIWIQIL